MDDDRRFGYLTVREVARRGGVSERRVRQVIEAGDLVAFKLAGAWWIFPGSADVWIHSDRRPGRRIKGKGRVKGRQAAMELENDT